MGKPHEDPAWLETRRELVDAVRRGLLTGAEVSAQLGVSGSVLGGWVRAEQMQHHVRSRQHRLIAGRDKVSEAMTVAACEREPERTTLRDQCGVAGSRRG